MTHGNGTRWIAVVAVAAMGAMGTAASASELGFKIGANMATLNASTFKNTDPVTGLLGGGYVSLGLGTVALEVDLLFSAKGYKLADTAQATALTVVNKFNYIEVPVLLKYMLVPKGPVRPYLAGGPAIAFLMSAESKTELSGATTTTDVKSALANYDYSIVLDAGVSLDVGVMLSLDVRYSIGLADISRTEGVNTRNSVISILGGIGF